MSLSSIIKTKCEVCGVVAEEVSRLDLGDVKLISLKCGHVATQAVIKDSDYSAVVSSDGRSLMPFQIDGIKFLEQANGKALIADEQGLGKTVQACGFFRLHKDVSTPAIIITKTGIKKQWMWELIRWVGSKKVQVIDSKKVNAIPGFDFYVTTYDMVKDEGLFSDVIDEVQCIVLDEVQAIKNHLSGRAKAIQSLAVKIPKIIALSGTPIKNNAGEYFTILNILQPNRFHSYASFLRNYCDSYETMYGYKVAGLRSIDEFQRATSDFIIRRVQKDVLPDLFALKNPRKFQYVELDPKFNKAYERGLKELDDLFYSEDDGNKMSASIAIMTKLRQITGLSKATDAIDLVTEHVISTNRKIILFAHHHAVVDLLEIELNRWMKDGGFENVVVIRAGDNGSDKVRDFIQENCKVCIASTLASGEGLDGLQKVCSDMIILERQWNPANEEQVEGRLARIGQELPVNITYMLGAGTIDDFFTELVERKRSYVSGALDGEAVDWNESSLMTELMTMLVTKGKKKWSL